MATKPAPKAAPKKALPARGQRTATNIATSGMDKSWQAREDMHHLKHAAEVKSDPSRHKAAVSEAKNQMAALSKVVKK